MDPKYSQLEYPRKRHGIPGGEKKRKISLEIYDKSTWNSGRSTSKRFISLTKVGGGVQFLFLSEKPVFHFHNNFRLWPGLHNISRFCLKWVLASVSIWEEKVSKSYLSLFINDLNIDFFIRKIKLRGSPHCEKYQNSSKCFKFFEKWILSGKHFLYPLRIFLDPALTLLWFLDF